MTNPETVSERMAATFAALTLADLPDHAREVGINDLLDMAGLCIAARKTEYIAKIIAGWDISSATMPAMAEAGGMMAESNLMADRDEDFNTRYASYRGWQMAIQRVKPIERATAAIDFAAMVRDAGLATTAEVVDHMLMRLLRVPVGEAERQMLIAFLDGELGTSDIARAESYLEDGLRLLVHLIMSQPEYQLG